MNRRQVVGGGAAVLASGITTPLLAADRATLSFTPTAGPRSRMIFVNDLSGDIDGLFAAVHAVLSPSTELRGIVATASGQASETAEKAAALGEEILHLMGRTGKIRVYVGARTKLTSLTPIRSAGTQAIIDEARRTDTDLPLYVAVGGGLTEVASAVLLDPSIAGRFTLVWIGGDAYPAGGKGETNFNLDPLAAQYLYNDTQVPILQVSRAAYASCVVSATELQAFVAPHGAIGDWLYRKVVGAPAWLHNVFNTGETWTLGDNPLVLLTALGDWVPSTGPRPFRYERFGSSHATVISTPKLNADGTFLPRADGRQIQIFDTVDTRLVLGDFFAKMRVNFPS